MITAAFEGATGVGVGDTVTVRLHTPEQIERPAHGPPRRREPSGPVIETTIVGKVRSPWFSDTADRPSEALIAVPTASCEQHEANLIGSPRARSASTRSSELEDGAAGIGRFREQLAEVTRSATTSSSSTSARDGATRRT